MKLAVVLVHYHTPRLLQAACAALLATAEGIELEGVIVDNGSRPQDRELLAALPFRCLAPGDNLGYAGGAGLGVAATTAERIVVMNPDVLVRPGCLAALAAALDGADAAGPRFFWDEDRSFLLPPTEPVSRRAELLRLLAARGRGWARRARRRWRDHARRHWLATAPLASFDLSGALLALRREAWQRVGPFDPGYRLYFEETDWLQRLRRAGLAARFVPAAEAVHLYAQSTRQEGEADAWLVASNRRFRRRFFGPAFTAALELAGRWLPPRGGAAPRAELGTPPADGSSVDRGAVWLEVSPSPLGFPAAARLPGTAAGTRLPDAVWRRLGPGTYYLRAVDDAGRELAAWSVEKRDSALTP